MLTTNSDGIVRSTGNATTTGPVSLGPTVERIIAETQKCSLTDRRSDFRYAYPRLVTVTPVDKTGSIEQGASLTVVGKHLSLRGFGFFHTAPLTCRYVIAEFEDAHGCTKILINLIWCRFIREGWYDSGGKFLRVVGVPTAASVTRHEEPKKEISTNSGFHP